MTDLLVVQPGTKLPTLAGVAGDFGDWIADRMGVAPGRFHRVRPHRGEPLPDPGRYRAVVVTGSSAMVTDPDDWIGACAHWMRETVSRHIPVLGICFGHQLLARTLGGQVDNNPRGIEVGTAVLRLTGDAASDPLLGPVADPARFQVSHRQSVLRLPPGARLLAATALDPHHAFAVQGNAWGLQFHPEFDERVVRAYLAHYESELEQRGVATANLETEICETPAGPVLLRRFAALAGIGRG
jgi:GMP synthase (glutamine-hydrolysing)